MARHLKRGDRLVGQESGRRVTLLYRERFTGSDGWAVELPGGAEAWVSDDQLAHFTLASTPQPADQQEGEQRGD